MQNYSKHTKYKMQLTYLLNGELGAGYKPFHAKYMLQLLGTNMAKKIKI